VTFPDEPRNDTYQEERKKQRFLIHNENTYSESFVIINPS